MKNLSNQDVVEKLKSFVNGSKTFNSFTFNGCYGMRRENFFASFLNFLETGENVLDEYSNLQYLAWGQYNNTEDFEYYDSVERERISTVLENEGFWDCYKILDKERVEDIRKSLYLSELRDKNEALYSARRKKATAYTSKKEVRIKVFDEHGEVCSKCGSTDNIHLDHIVPVLHGGEDSIDNLQPLCRSCNSSKGAKIEEVING